jgi:hypothetical protein
MLQLDLTAIQALTIKVSLGLHTSKFRSLVTSLRLWAERLKLEAQSGPVSERRTADAIGISAAAEENMRSARNALAAAEDVSANSDRLCKIVDAFLLDVVAA